MLSWVRACASLAVRRHEPLRSMWRVCGAHMSSVAHAGDTDERLVITTPIFYVNGEPHIGHMFSGLLADAAARWHRMHGKEVLFTTGTDEHGLKVQQAAAKRGVSPQELCDEVSSAFQRGFDELSISYDDFVRTTEPRHRRAVEHLWRTVAERGHIYTDKYAGWYCVNEEMFIADAEVTGTGDARRCPNDHAVEFIEEETYKFRLSAFRTALHAWLDTQPVTPRARWNELRALVDNDDAMRDFSASRPAERLSWGIGVPSDASHTMYVWFDALVNYLTVCGYPDTPRGWPAVHVIGKDILRFHGVYWPAMLAAAGLPPPKHIVAHAHFTVGGRKMSKSLGNVVSPAWCVEHYGVDATRYALLREGGIENDGDWSPSTIHTRITDDLADTMGNLLSRCTGARVNTSRALPPLHAHALTTDDEAFVAQIRALPAMVSPHMEAFRVQRALVAVNELMREANRYFSRHQPWNMAKAVRTGNDEEGELQQRLDTVLHITMEALRVAALLQQPVMPGAMRRLLDHLGVPREKRTATHFAFGREDEVGAPVSAERMVLFPVPREPPAPEP